MLTKVTAAFRSRPGGAELEDNGGVRLALGARGVRSRTVHLNCMASFPVGLAIGALMQATPLPPMVSSSPISRVLLSLVFFKARSLAPDSSTFL